MKIAFTSCSCVNLVKDAAIWDRVRAARPQHLVLLGDSIYLDVPSPGMAALQAMGDWEFAEHLFVRYAQQLAVPAFRRLIADPAIQIHAIWDDHDFAWNDAQGTKLLANPLQEGKVWLSTAFMREFRRVLAAHDANSFPSSAGDAAFWRHYPPQPFMPLGATTLPLTPDGRAFLHLTDGRTARGKAQLLGQAQRTQLDAAFTAAPQALHVIASGSTFNQSDSWQGCATDYQWLRARLAGRGWLMLSGDVHSNGLTVHRVPGQGRLVEATSSGAAIFANLNKLIPGSEVSNHGIVDLLDNEVQISLFAFDALATQASFARTQGGELVAP